MWHQSIACSNSSMYVCTYVSTYLYRIPWNSLQVDASISQLFINTISKWYSTFIVPRVCGRSARTVFSKRFYVFKSWEIGPCLFDCPVSFFLSPKNAGVDHDEHLPSSPLLLCYLDVAYRMDKTAVPSMGYRKPSNCRELVIFKSPITICFILLLSLLVSPWNTAGYGDMSSRFPVMKLAKCTSSGRLWWALCIVSKQLFSNLILCVWICYRSQIIASH